MSLIPSRSFRRIRDATSFCPRGPWPCKTDRLLLFLLPVLRPRGHWPDPEVQSCKTNWLLTSSSFLVLRPRGHRPDPEARNYKKAYRLLTSSSCPPSVRSLTCCETDWLLSSSFLSSIHEVTDLVLKSRAVGPTGCFPSSFFLSSVHEVTDLILKSRAVRPTGCCGGSGY